MSESIESIIKKLEHIQELIYRGDYYSAKNEAYEAQLLAIYIKDHEIGK